MKSRLSRSESGESVRKPGVFYGYWIVASCLVTLLIWSGSTYYAFGIFLKAVESEFGWGRGATAAAFTVFMLVQGFGGPLIGRLIDRYGPRLVIAGGAVLTGAGFALLSFTQSLPYFYAVYVLAGFGSVGIGIVPAGALVSNWFTARRGTAMGVAASGLGLGGLVMGPLVGDLLIPSIGWRLTYWVLALAIWLVIIPLTLLVVETRPQDRGLLPDGKPRPTPAAGGKAPVPVEIWTFSRALGTPTFWLIGVGFLGTSIASNGVFQHQVLFFSDMGVTVSVVSAAIGVSGLASAAGKIVFGWLSDRLAPKYCAAIAYGLQTTAVILVLTIKTPAVLWPFAIFIGLGMGGWAPLSAMLIGANFGIYAFGAIYGMLIVLQYTGTGAGPLIAGYWYDATHDYSSAFLLFACLCLVSIASILVVRRPRR